MTAAGSEQTVSPAISVGGARASHPQPFIPVVSIIIPALQEEKEIENLLSQITDELKSRFRCEVIVSDGGSKDRTAEIADRNAARIVHALRSDPTIASGRNLGARAANGISSCFSMPMCG